jgi:hypothetical protein
MGLLDDAIREHLELKRLRGADPGAVAREEQDALGPVLRDQDEVGGHKASSEADRSDSPGVEPSDYPMAGQETIEINMDAEFAADTDLGHEQEAPSKRAAPGAQPADTSASTEESLGWEVPGRPGESGTGPGSEGDADSSAGDAESVEDVLEETPDFLRDTPEQERLWFEQRPPRDFDFNE